MLSNYTCHMKIKRCESDTKDYALEEVKERKKSLSCLSATLTMAMTNYPSTSPLFLQRYTNIQPFVCINCDCHETVCEFPSESLKPLLSKTFPSSDGTWRHKITSLIPPDQVVSPFPPTQLIFISNMLLTCFLVSHSLIV